MSLEDFTTKSRSISTVEGSEATCTRNFLNYFFKTGDLSMVQLTQNMQKISKKWKKRQKCIDITLRKWSWRPLWQVGKKTCWRFHRPPGELFEGFGIFPHLSTCLGGLEKSQTLQTLTVSLTVKIPFLTTSLTIPTIFALKCNKFTPLSQITENSRCSKLAWNGFRSEPCRV